MPFQRNKKKTRFGERIKYLVEIQFSSGQNLSLVFLIFEFSAFLNYHLYRNKSTHRFLSITFLLLDEFP